MLELADIAQQIAHTSIVRGGAMLFGGDLDPVLWPGKQEKRQPGLRPLRDGLTVRKAGRTRITGAESAEAVRQLKDLWGVPHRPVPKDGS